MTGFISSVSQDLNSVFAKNADFSGSNDPGDSHGLTANNDVWMGSTALNPTGSHVNVMTLTEGPGVHFVYTAPVGPGFSKGTFQIGLSGGGVGIDSIAVDTGSSPVAPDGSGLVTMTGAVVAAGNNPIRTDGTVANTLAIEVQTSQALAAADATKIGLSNFDSTSFSVAATGFVTLSTTGAGKTITGDNAVALSPTANNWNILGGPGVTTTGSGSTLTINSTVFTDTTATTLAVDNGYFATAAGTYALPATAAQGELITIVCDTAGAVVVDAPALNFIRVGSAITAASGTATSNAIGDSLTLRYRLATLTWEATSVIGTWTIA